MLRRVPVAGFGAFAIVWSQKELVVKTWKEMTWSERLKLVALSIAPAVLLVVIAQTYAYLTIYRDIRVEDDPIHGTPAVYRMHFGKAWWGQTTETPLNSLGFPDDEFSDIGPKGECVHIVVSGDSFVFGDAVDRHRNFFSLVKRAMGRAHPDACVRFFNIGERMTTIQEQRERIRETRDLLQPDIVILGQYQNDLTDLTNPGNVAHVPPDTTEGGMWWGDVVRQRVPFANAAITRFLSYHAFAFMITRGVEYDILGQWSVLADGTNNDLAKQLTSIYGEMYAELAEELRAEGIEFGTIILPSKLDLLAGRYPEGDFFVSLAAENGLPYLTTFESLDAARADYPYQTYDGHLSEAGNAVVARELFQWLTQDAEAHPFPKLRATLYGRDAEHPR